MKLFHVVFGRNAKVDTQKKVKTKSVGIPRRKSSNLFSKKPSCTVGVPVPRRDATRPTAVERADSKTFLKRLLIKPILIRARAL